MFRLTKKNQEAIVCAKIQEIEFSEKYTPEDKQKLINYYKRQLKNPALRAAF